MSRPTERARQGRHLLAGSGLYARMLRGERSLGTSSLRGVTRLLSWGYGAAVALRNALYDRGWAPCASRRISVPVLSMGNLSVGGTGKSLAALAIAEAALARGLKPAIVSRGYRGGIDGAPTLSDEAAEQAERLGDAAILVCDPDRRAASLRAIEQGAQVIVLDDGFQHRRLARDLDAVCIDALAPEDSRHLLPRGLLRESARSLRRARLVLLSRADLAAPEHLEKLEAWIRAAGFTGPIEAAEHRPARVRPLGGERAGLADRELSGPSSLAERRVLLASGVGNPAGFEGTVTALGAEIAGHVAMPDHHRWSEADCREAEAMRREVEAELILTTGKDAVKLVTLPDVDRANWRVLDVELAARERPGCFAELLDAALDAHASNPSDRESSP